MISPLMLAKENSTKIFPGMTTLLTHYEANEFIVSADNLSNIPMPSPAHVHHVIDA